MIFPLIAQIIESSLAQHGFTPVLCTQTYGGITEDEYVELLLDRQVAGIVFVSGLHADTNADPNRYRKLVSRPLPIVLINGFLTNVEAPFVSCDDRAAGQLAVRPLATLGHRRIGLISGPVDVLCARARLDGWRAALDAAGVTASGPLRAGEFTVGEGLLHASELLSTPDRPSAILAGNDLQALGVYEAARRLGLRIPDDLSVVGFADLPVAAWVGPGLTTVRQPLVDMAVAATDLVIRLARQEAPDDTRLELATHLIVRESTASA